MEGPRAERDRGAWADGVRGFGLWIGEFKILGTAITAEETVTGELETGQTTKLLVEGLNLVLLCTGLDPSGTIKSGGKGTLTLLYLGCNAETDESPAKVLPCTVSSVGDAAGMMTVSSVAEVILHGTPSKTYLLAKPVSGTTFTTITLTGTKCALPEENKVAGTAIGEVGAEAVNLLLKPIEKPEVEFPEDGIKFGAHRAFLSGFGLAHLTGAKVGCSWGAI